MRVIYIKSDKVQSQRDSLIATNKQLLLDLSGSMSGAEVKDKANNILHMRPLKVDEDRPWKSGAQYIELPK